MRDADEILCQSELTTSHIYTPCVKTSHDCRTLAYMMITHLPCYQVLIYKVRVLACCWFKVGTFTA